MLQNYVKDAEQPKEAGGSGRRRMLHPCRGRLYTPAQQETFGQYIMFLMRADPLLRQVGGDWADLRFLCYFESVFCLLYRIGTFMNVKSAITLIKSGSVSKFHGSGTLQKAVLYLFNST